MAINFPTSLDVAGTFPSTIVDADDQLTTHPTLHNNVDLAVLALEAKVGVDGSAVTTSLDYIAKNAPGQSLMTANGDLIIRAAGVPARLAVGSANQWLGVSAGLPAWRDQSALDHGSLGGLADDDHAGHAWLAGRSGGQTQYGDTASGGNYTISSTAHATKGKILVGSISMAIDEVNTRLGIGTTSPSYPLDVTGNARLCNSSGTLGIGGIPIANAGMNIAVGATDATAVFGMYMGGQTLTPTANNASTYGFYAGGTIATGTYTGLTASAAYIAAQAKTGTGTITNAIAVNIAKPTIAGTNNVYFAFDTADGTALGAYSGRVPVLVGGAVRYIPYYA